MTYGYADLIDRRTGHVDPAAFAHILTATIQAETNLAICCRADIGCPRHVLYREVRGWYAERAELIGDNLAPAEHAEIASVERQHLLNLCESMRDASTEATRQLIAEAA